MSDNIIQLNEDLMRHDLKDFVPSSVEETLNALLDKKADELVNVQKCERSSDCQDHCSGHYKRNFQTTAGDAELKVPKLKGLLLKLPLLSITAAGNLPRRKLSPKCICPVFLSAVLRISQKLSGELNISQYHQQP